MSYTSEYLQFGSNEVRVPGYEEDLKPTNEHDPIPKTLVDQHNGDLWYLLFSYESGTFYLPGTKVPGVDGAIIQSWYRKNGGVDHVLAFTPFLIDANGAGGFAQASHYVDFSETPATDGSVDTDTIPHASVTATVHPGLPEYSNQSIATQSTSHSIFVNTTTTQATFDDIFVYAGSSVPVGNSLTVPKNQSCFALAVFKKTTNSSSSETGTVQYPTIPKWEWQAIVAEVVKRTMTKGNGEIYEYLSPGLIASLGQEAARTAIADIGKRIESLGKVKTLISGLSEKASN